MPEIWLFPQEQIDEIVHETLRRKQQLQEELMKTLRPKKTRVNKDAVTIADLEREIADLRLGLRNQTELLSTIQKENIALRDNYRRVKDDLLETRGNLEAATRDVIRQQEFQGRAHETIERLSKVMEAMVTAKITVDSVEIE